MSQDIVVNAEAASAIRMFAKVLLNLASKLDGPGLSKDDIIFETLLPSLRSVTKVVERLLDTDRMTEGPVRPS